MQTTDQLGFQTAANMPFEKPDLAALANLNPPLMSLGVRHMNPDAADAMFNEAATLQSNSKFEAARSLWERWATAYKSQVFAARRLPDFYSNYGAVLLALGDFPAATKQLREGIRLNEWHFSLQQNLGLALMSQQDYDGALHAFGIALAINPTNPRVHNNMCVALAKLGRFDDALMAGQRATSLDAKYADAWSNCGMVRYFGHGDPDTAFPMLRRAVELEPTDRRAHRNLGMALLSDGQFAEGFYEYEYRDKMRYPLAYNLPRWNGERLVDGSRVIIRGEQGLGDEIFFFRHVVAMAQKKGAPAFVYECDPRLVPLFKRYIGNLLDIVARTRPALPVVSQIDAGNLPQHFQSPVQPLYLYAEMERSAAFEELLRPEVGGRRRPVVGIAWYSGNENYSGQKSIKTADLDPLLSIPGIRFVSLQYGTPPAGYERDPRIEEVPGLDLTNDIDGVAALIEGGCDAVVTVSTTVAHLAGGLRAQTIVFVPRGLGRFFYWNRDDWFPFMVTQLRQQTVGDWSGQIAEAAGILRDKFT